MNATRRIMRAALLTALAAIALALASGEDASASHVTNSTTRWVIDADVSGNTAIAYGPIENCVTAKPGADVLVDVIAEDIPAVDTKGTPESVDDTGGVFGYHFDMTYDVAGVSVTTADADFLLGSLPGSSAVGVPTDPLPDIDGAFLFDALDLGVIPTTTESGSGVLARVTVNVNLGASPGTYTLSLGDPVHVDAHNDSYHTPIVYSALLAVDVPCPGPALTGDSDCSGTVNSVDGLKILRYAAGLAVAQTDPCSDVGSQSPAVGDVDCSNTTNSVDALKVLRFGSGLSYTKVHFCEDIGA